MSIMPDSKSIITVDRSVNERPDWAKDFVFSDFKSFGPSRYDVVDVLRWLHKVQQDNRNILGYDLYRYLCDKDMIRYCLGLPDLWAIQAKGGDFLRQHFGPGVVIFGFKSIMMDQDCCLQAPYILEKNDLVVEGWHKLYNYWFPHYPVLHFAK